MLMVSQSFCRRLLTWRMGARIDRTTGPDRRRGERWRSRCRRRRCLRSAAAAAAAANG